MELDIYRINAFTIESFGGNPACVIQLDSWLPDELLLKIANENAVPETAYFVKHEEYFHLRWFTPDIEMDLCGHATLATAWVIKKHLKYKDDTILFQTVSGTLGVSYYEDRLTLDFPSRPPVEDSLPENIMNSLNIKPKKILKSRDYVLVYDTDEEIKNIKIDRQLFDQINLDPGGVIVTAPGLEYDFVSRFFTPQATILEDPVTGSAHCSLIPYWSKVLEKDTLVARQISKRGGELYCRDLDDRVLISGYAKTFFKGKIII
jgi:PhzF family phenazine biosynthesis protein